MTLFHFCDFIFQFVTKVKLLKSTDFTYKGKPRSLGARDSFIWSFCFSVWSTHEHTYAKRTRLADVDISECQYPSRYDSLKADESDVNFRWTLCHEFVSVAHKLGHKPFREVVSGSI